VSNLAPGQGAGVAAVSEHNGAVGKQLNLRFVPAIDFAYDDSEEEAGRIDALLNKIKN